MPLRPHPALAPIAALFGPLTRLRNALYDHELIRSRRLPVPVVSVGNLSVGGTGKTPMVALLAARLADAGRRPAIVSRGHGGTNARRHSTPLIVSSGTGGDLAVSAAQSGDEPAMLARLLPRVPVVVGRNRYTAGRLAIERFHVDLVLLDDGLQHRRLHRDVDLVTLDAGLSLRTARLLPAGTLREQPSALRRAHLAVITRADDESAVARLRDEVQFHHPGLPVYCSRHRPVALVDLPPGGAAGVLFSRLPTRSPTVLAGRRVSAFAGMAQPGSLRRTLESLGALVVRFDPLPDHHVFGPGEVKRLVEAGRRAGAEFTVTSAKDAVRLQPEQLPEGLTVLRIEAEVAEIDRLVARVLALCQPSSSSVSGETG